jgi:succinate-acetate transporter protein
LSNDTTANPAPLGLMGFGLTTILLSLSNAGYFALGAAILTMGLFFGGSAQIIAGLMEYKKGNTFGMTVFCSFGFFWIVVITTILAPKLGLAGVESPQAMAWLFFLWGVYVVYLTLGTLRTNRVMQFTFAALALVLFLLSAADALINGDLKVLAGYVGILAGAGAVYLKERPSGIPGQEVGNHQQTLFSFLVILISNFYEKKAKPRAARRKESLSMPLIGWSIQRR